jgi:hypothetical protein
VAPDHSHAEERLKKGPSDRCQAAGAQWIQDDHRHRLRVPTGGPVPSAKRHLWNDGSLVDATMEYCPPPLSTHSFCMPHQVTRFASSTAMEMTCHPSLTRSASTPHSPRRANKSLASAHRWSALRAVRQVLKSMVGISSPRPCASRINDSATSLAEAHNGHSTITTLPHQRCQRQQGGGPSGKALTTTGAEPSPWTVSVAGQG